MRRLAVDHAAAAAAVINPAHSLHACHTVHAFLPQNVAKLLALKNSCFWPTLYILGYISYILQVRWRNLLLPGVTFFGISRTILNELLKK